MSRIMGRIQWRCRELPKDILERFVQFLRYLELSRKSLFYNHHLNQSYLADVCMEPMFWFVDNFAHILGSFMVISVALLTALVVFICYWIGLPFWWDKNPQFTVILLIVGNWLLVNVVFNYYMAAATPAGDCPEGNQIIEAVSICKKCISPKPPRTHHCSVCNKCILKMDHHCPWLNNCVGFSNHRFFFLYMTYTTIGCLFIIIFGLEIGYNYIWLDDGESWTEVEPLSGHPVKYNLTGHIIPVTEFNQYDNEHFPPAKHDLPVPYSHKNNGIKRKAIIFMAFITIAVVIALGSLCIWHVRLITKGETSIETHINKSEAKRLREIGREYVNPYDFGKAKNWKLFLGLVRGRTWWRHVLLPSAHKPEGNGLSFHTVHDLNGHDDWP